MTDFKFSLEKGSKKGHCPNPKCQKKTYVRYVFTDTGEYLPEQYGRCDRAENCGYHLNPYKDGYATDQGRIGSQANVKAYTSAAPFKKEKQRQRVFIPNEILEATIANGFDKNIFIQNLLKRVPHPVDPGDLQKVADLYKTGTIVKGGTLPDGGRHGSITFPHIDEKGGCRTIQTRAYGLDNHSIKNGTDFVHSIIAKQYQSKAEGAPSWPATSQALPKWLEAYLKNDGYLSCLFGAHLLPKYPTNHICIVEAPKTAIIATLYFGIPDGPDDKIWLAATSQKGLTIEKCKVLQGRTVHLYPDLSNDAFTYNLWRDKATEIMKAYPGTRVVVSDYLERIATNEQRAKGYDIADLLILEDWRLYRKAKTEKVSITEKVKTQTTPAREEITIPTPEPITMAEPSPIEKPYIPPQNFNTGSWSKEIEQIDKFFEAVECLDGPIKLNGIHPVTDLKGFLNANLEVARAQSGNPTYLPYLTRVKDLIKHLESVKNNSPIHNTDGHLLHSVTFLQAGRN